LGAAAGGLRARAAIIRCSPEQAGRATAITEAPARCQTRRGDRTNRGAGRPADRRAGLAGRHAGRHADLQAGGRADRQAVVQAGGRAGTGGAWAARRGRAELYRGWAGVDAGHAAQPRRSRAIHNAGARADRPAWDVESWLGGTSGVSRAGG
jgi:hypothetical protein